MLSKQLFQGGLALRTIGVGAGQDSHKNVISDSIKGKPEVTQEHKKKTHVQKAHFDDRYIVEQELGQGAHAVVKKCRKKANNKEYAVKIIRSNDEEIMIAAKNCYNLQKIVQKCPLICKTYELFIEEDKENICQVMEYIKHPSLNSLAQKHENRQIPPEIVKTIIRQLCEVVKYIHGMGICHRDLKPDNILVDPSNKYTIKVIDFGISRKFQSRDPCNKYIYITHNMWSRTGTLCYKSPEMFSSAAYNESCDMWSVAVIAYELLTGKLPFYQEYQTDTIEQIENCQYTFDDVGNFKWKDNKYAKDFIKRILKVVENKSKRLTASEALVHPWLQDKQASKVVKDDVYLKNTQFKVPEMGKSTDVLMQLHSTYVKKKKSANNINPNPSQVSNSGMQLSTLKASYMGSNNMLMGSRINQGNQYMTTSQIQLLRGDDIHVIKQTGFNFGGFHQNNSEVSNAGNGFKITLPDISMRKVKNNIRANQEQAESGMQTPMFQKEQHDYMGKGDEQIHIKKGSEDEYQNMLGSRQPSQSICYADYTQYQQQATNSGNNSQEQEQNPQQSAFLLTKYNPSEQMCISRSEVDEPDSMKFLIPSQSIKCSLDNSQALHMSQLQKSLTKSNDSGVGAGIGGLTQDEEWFNAEIRASKSIGLTSSNIKEQFPNEEHIIEEEENEEVITTPGNLTLRNEQFFTSMKSNQYSDDMETPSFTNKNQQSNLIQQQQIKITKRKESDQSNNSGKQISSFQNKSKKQSEDSLEGFEDLQLKGAKSNLVENPYYDIQPPLLQVNSDKTNQSNLQQNQTRSPYQNLNNCTSPSFQETN